MAEPILNLNTLVDRRVVRIDGKDYELIASGELSLLDYHRIGRQSGRVEELMTRSEDLSDAEVQELSRMLKDLCCLILRAPEELHARLNDLHRLAVIQAFSNLQRDQKKAAPAGEGSAPPTSTGASSSPASAGSTEARPASGSRRRRSRSS